MSDIAKLRKTLGLSQQATADRASIARSVISQVEGKHQGLSVAASLKAAPVLQVHPGVLYLGTQLAAIKAKLEEEEITEDAAADKLLRILRTVLEKFEDIEDEAEADELISALEELLAETTGKTVENVKGKGVATKSAAPTFVDEQLRIVGKAAPRDIDEGDPHRDLTGKAVAPFALDSRNLRDDDEHGFEDPSAYGEANIPVDYDDEDLEGRDAFGQRVRPLNGRR